MSGNDERTDSLECLCNNKSPKNKFFKVYNNDNELIGYINPPTYLKTDNRKDKINMPLGASKNVDNAKRVLDDALYFICNQCLNRIIVDSNLGNILMRYGRSFIQEVRDNPTINYWDI